MAAPKLISHKLCPYVQRAVIALHEKGVPFERIDIDLGNKPDWFLKISPLGKVPVLVVTRDDGAEVALFESNVICEYIEETQAGARLHPKEALVRAEHRAWMEFGSAILGDLWGLETATDAAAFEGKRQAVAAKFARVEAALGAGPFFAGPNFSLVDAVFAPVFRYFDLFDQLTDLAVFTHTAKLRAWRRALAQRPSVRSAVSPDYPALLHAFLVGHRAHMLKLAA
ncbi:MULTISPECIES: glutathione S-transferase family protein [unclassified Bradyrhizobium]|uniref:glutathione S-transferase family protein n=1 Tax=unclassified Bradyrhizobium TaxID=2631580 RepID=UPI0003F818C3|nr:MULTISPECIES: glutathione S-transferase family protein [unclassified Bradyrhizobium]QIG91777.1 glutathione S-transferase family protein [Bradyrhizobium sp. 6(2017)]